jgi:hypothetical protein
MPDLGTRRLRLFVGGDEFTSSISNCRITADQSDSDFVSFAEAASGGARQYTLALTMKQNTDADSLWYYIWANAGDDVPVVIWPNGQNNVSPTTPTTTYPKFSGTVTVTEPDGDLLGGDADQSNTARFTTDVEWVFTGKPQLDDGTS